MGEAFLLDSGHPEVTSLTHQDREWPEQGIRVSEDKQEALEDCRKLCECFKKLKKQIESITPPSSPENGPGSSETSACSKTTNNAAPFCQGLLLVPGNQLSPSEDKYDDKLKYLEDEEWKKSEKKLGIGDTAEVSEAQDLSTKYICAVKQYEPFEGFAWAQLNHQNIPKLYGIVREKHADDISDAGKVFLFCEEIKNHKQFLKFIEEDCEKWPSFLVKEFIDTVEKQVTSAVDHIHSKGLAHNDLTLFNVVIEESDRKAWVIDFGRTTPVFGKEQEVDKLFIEELMLKAREILKDKMLKEKEEAEEELQRLKIEGEKKGAAGAASNTLPTAGPPKSDYNMDGGAGGERVKGSRFSRVKTDGTSSAASISPSPSTSKRDDLSEDDTQDQDQFKIAAINKNLVKNPSNQVPSNENMPREDTKHQPVSEIQPSRVENQ